MSRFAGPAWSDFLRGGISENLKQAGVQMPVASNVVGGLLQSPDVNAAIGMASPIRAPLTSNYRVPLSTYTDRLWREMHPDAALEVLPGSNVSAGHPFGPPRDFYADTPELALGQGNNRGVRVEYDSHAFEGQVNTKKPAWQPLWEQGQAEYQASPIQGKSQRDAVRSIEIDRGALNAEPRVTRIMYRNLLDRLERAGWGVNRTDDKFTATRPDLLEK